MTSRIDFGKNPHVEFWEKKVSSDIDFAKMEQVKRRRYVVTGGEVFSAFDHQRHWISPSRVADLFKVRAKECYIIHGPESLLGLRHRTDLIWLRPQYTNYTLPTETTSCDVIAEYVERVYPKKGTNESQESERRVDPKTNTDWDDNQSHSISISGVTMGESRPVPRQDVESDRGVVCETLPEIREDAGAGNPDII